MNFIALCRCYVQCHMALHHVHVQLHVACKRFA
jgi:hypothetical protein